MKLKEWTLTMLFLGATAALIVGMAWAAGREQGKLVAKKIDSAPVIDGEIEGLWQQAPQISIPVTGGRSGKKTVNMRALYSNTHVYFVVQWDDGREDLARQPWEYDGQNWVQLPGGGAYYEDKFAIYWNVNDSTEGFNEKGCKITCHSSQGATKYGSHRTNSPGELVDQWHWKAARTGPVDQMDDQFVNWIRNGEPNLAGEPSKEAGRQGDPKTGGGYTINIDKKNNRPVYTFRDPKNPLVSKYIIMKEEAVEIEDFSQFKKGDIVPGHISAPFEGNRGDISARGIWRNNAWTLEIARKLSTGSKHDVDFSDLEKAYYFGVAPFDKEQWDHSYSLGVYQVVFSK